MTLDTVYRLVSRITGKRLDRARTVAGFAWVREHAGRRYVLASAGSRPGYYRVDGQGCTCPGYQHFGYCKHHDAVMLRLAGGRKPAAAGIVVPFPVAGRKVAA